VGLVVPYGTLGSERVNIEKNGKWEALISILVENKRKKKKNVREGKKKRKKIGLVTFPM